MNQGFILRVTLGLQILLLNTFVYAQHETYARSLTSNVSSLPASIVLLLEDKCDYTHPNQPFDDPNPLYDGSRGRYPVLSNPIPAGYPTPLTTGLCGVGLTPDDLSPSASITATQDNAIIDRLDVAGSIWVEANNVTIRTTRISSSSTYALQLKSGFSGLLVEDTRIRGVGDTPSSAVLVANGATFRRVHITGGSDNVKSNSGDLTVTDSYIGGTYRSPGSHNDVVQICNGSNYSFTHNTMLGPWRMSTSVFIIQAKAGAGGSPISNVTISGNYLSGGGYTAYTTNRDFPMTNVEVTANIIELDSWQYGYKNNSALANWHDNYDSSGAQLD